MWCVNEEESAFVCLYTVCLFVHVCALNRCEGGLIYHSTYTNVSPGEYEEGGV